MNTEYRKVETDIGTDLDETITLLKEYNKKGEKVCVDFNDHTLYSDKINEDEIYKLITEKTKNEFLEFVASEEKKMTDKFKTKK